MTLPLTMPAHFHHAPTFAQVRAELARELQARRRLYPDRIAKGRMDPQEADFQQAIIAAIAQDLDAVIAVAVPQLPRRAFTWAQKRQALLRELEYRARFYPEWIAKGRLTRDQADHQSACLAAMLALYDDGLTWEPTPPDCPAEQRRQQWRDLSAQLAPVSTHQKELAL